MRYFQSIQCDGCQKLLFSVTVDGQVVDFCGISTKLFLPIDAVSPVSLDGWIVTHIFKSDTIFYGTLSSKIQYRSAFWF